MAQVNEYSTHMQDFVSGNSYKSLLKASASLSASSQESARELNTRPIRAFARVRQVDSNTYRIRAFGNKENIGTIIKRLKAFNDMEICYDDDLDSNELIVKSKKELWTISKADNGEFILQRAF